MEIALNKMIVIILNDSNFILDLEALWMQSIYGKINGDLGEILVLIDSFLFLYMPEPCLHRGGKIYLNKLKFLIVI